MITTTPRTEASPLRLAKRMSRMPPSAVREKHRRENLALGGIVSVDELQHRVEIGSANFRRLIATILDFDQLKREIRVFVVATNASGLKDRLHRLGELVGSLHGDRGREIEDDGESGETELLLCLANDRVIEFAGPLGARGLRDCHFRAGLHDAGIDVAILHNGLTRLGVLDRHQHRACLARLRAQFQYDLEIGLRLGREFLGQAPARELEMLVGIFFGDLIELVLVKVGDRRERLLDAILGDDDFAAVAMNHEALVVLGHLAGKMLTIVQ